MKTNRFFLFAVLAIAMVAQSCSIATSVHFNKDYSGRYTTIFDFADLISFAGMQDTTGTMDQAQMVEDMRHKIDSLQLEQTYNELSGIDNANVEVSDEGVLTVGYDFENIESLNASFKTLEERTMQMEEMEGSMDMLPADFFGGKFSRQGKVLTYSVDSENPFGEGLDEGEDSGDLDMLTSMLDMTFDLSFDRKIKSVDVEGVNIVEKTSNLVKTRIDLANFMKSGKYSIRIKTK
jgi:hypothetical protein